MECLRAYKRYFSARSRYLSQAKWSLVLLALGWIAVVPSRANLITNGGFTTNTCSTADGQLTVNGCSVSGWTGLGKEGMYGSQTTPPTFLFPSTAGQTGVTGDSFMGTVDFYGVTAPPSGSYFIAGDGDPAWGGGISQTVNGLITGDTYTLTFNWAGAQQQGYSGSTTEAWQVSLGGSTQSTATVNTPSESFDGWQTASMNFMASSTSELLSFLAVGTPSGEPPWLLINGIDLENTTSSPTPEPMAAGLLVLGGLVCIPAVRRLRRKVN